MKERAAHVLRLVMVSLSFVAFALGGQTFAASSSISTTGPNSNNNITSNNSVVCDVSNTNDLGIDSKANQVVKSGDINISNATSVGSGWSEWDPALWQARGYTYEQWHSAFMSYMSTNQQSLQSNWSSLKPSGSVQTGDTSNSNVSAYDISIQNNNGGLCGSLHSPTTTGTSGNSGSSGTVSTTGPGSSNSVDTDRNARTNNSNGTSMGGTNNNGQPTGSGNTGSRSATSTGASGEYGSTDNTIHTLVSGAGSQNYQTQLPTQGNNSAPQNDTQSSQTISTTGPGSSNSITTTNSSSTVVENTNTISLMTIVTQNSDTGNINIGNTTSVGGVTTGDASNGNVSRYNVTISN